MDRRIRKTQTSIKRALVELMRKHTIDAITIKALAYEADIDRKTFYNHYASIHHAIRSVEDDIANHLFTITKQYDYKKIRHDPYPLLSQLSSAIENDKLFHTFLLHPDTTNSLLEKLKRIFRQEFIKSYANEFLGDPTMFGFAVDFIVSGTFDVYRQWVKEDKPVHLKSLSKTLSGVISRGLNYFNQRESA